MRARCSVARSADPSEYLVARGYGYERIDGNVSGIERQKRVDSFNAPDAKQFVFLLRFTHRSATAAA